MRATRRGLGFTLVELLIVVGVIGILSLIAIESFLQSIQRARQSRTVSDLRTIAAGVESYSIDVGRYPPSAGYTLPDGLALPTDDIRIAATYLAPTYVRSVPLADGWGSYFQYGVEGQYSQHYAVRSTGRDGTPDVIPAWGATTSFNADIVVVDGQFVQYPAAAQK